MDIYATFALYKYFNKYFLGIILFEQSSHLYIEMDKEFEDYWDTHQRHLILNAPESLRNAYLEASRLDSPIDWLGIIVPVGVGIMVQPFVKLQSEILTWAIVFVLVVVLFVIMQMIKPYFSKKKTESEVIAEIKQYYYERYKKIGDLNKLEPWRD